MNIPELEQMSVKSLRDLREQIDGAIRAAIAKSKTKVEPKPEAPVLIDLERERDEWTARRRS